MKVKLTRDWDSHDDPPKKGTVCEAKIVTRNRETSALINFNGAWWKTELSMIKVIER